MTPFDQALSLVLQQEGGRVNDPRDPGGRTNKGITQRVYSAWRQHHGQPARDVYAILDFEVADIYRHQYADPVRFDDLPLGVGYAVFDGAVNSGTVQSAKWLQRGLKMPAKDADGHIGVVTLAALRLFAPAELVNEICDQRLGLMRHLPTWAHFGSGWTKRIAFVRERALALAGATHSAPTGRG